MEGQNKKLATDNRNELPVPEKIITARKMPFGRTKPTPTPGFTPIFPNNWHGHAFGYESGDFSSLSPMRLGPASNPLGGKECGDKPSKPIVAHNVENFYQFAKVFADEVITGERCDCLNQTFPHDKPNPKFFAARDLAYADPIPHRHKKKGAKPLYSCYGNVHYTYIQSRWFYCIEMERLATPKEAYVRLKTLYDQGTHIEIHGYDAYKPDATDHETLYIHYLDEKRPFGHEMVLLAMIVIDDREKYPWHRYKRENEGIYPK